MWADISGTADGRPQVEDERRKDKVGAVMDNVIGVVSCHLAELEPIEEAFDRVSAYGIGEIEWFNCTKFEALYGEDIFQKIRDLSERSGIRASYHAACGGEWDMGLVDVPAAKLILERQMQMAERLGAQKITLHFGSYPAGRSREEARDHALRNVVQALKDSTERIEHSGMRIGVENFNLCYHPDDMGERVSDFDYLFSEINHPSIGFVLDTGHSNITGDTERYLEKFPDRLVHTHLHDNDGKSDSHSPPGQGTVDWGGLLQRLKDVGYSGTLCLEFPEASGEYRSFIQTLRKQ